jgi:PTH1 family peptidyl-tRNA hydrolase
MTIKLIIGLRNPGSAYELTRHNAGGWFVQTLAEVYKTPFTIEKKLYSELAELKLDHHSAKLGLPMVFMNLSGQSTRAICQFYRIQTEEILIAHDEIDLPAGRIKLKTGGGHGGHNGIRDIIAQLGTRDFHRLRIGVGHPGHKDLVTQYVLNKPSIHDKQLINESIERAIAVMPLVLSNDLAQAMNQLNT